MTFPEDLVFDDLRFVRDRTRVLVRFVETVDDETVAKLQDEYDIRRETEPYDEDDDDRQRGLKRVNNSARELFFGTEDGEGIDDDRLEALEEESEVACLSAVFHPEGDEGFESSIAVSSDRLIVKLGADVSPEEIDEFLDEEFDLRVNDRDVERRSRVRIYSVDLDEELDDRQMSYALRERVRRSDVDGIKSVSFNVRPLPSVFSAVTLNDADIGNQDHHATIESFEAWDDTVDGNHPHFGAGVRVAVISTGCELDHDDLENRYLREGGPTSAIVGYDAVHAADTTGTEPDRGGAPDPDGLFPEEGTRTAGVIAAEANNNVGVAGVAGASSIIPIRTEGDTQTFVEALEWAITLPSTQRPQVIFLHMGFNISGTPAMGTFIQDEIADAVANDIVVISPTGNWSGQVLYPASEDDVIAVGAADDSERRWADSMYGPELDFVAPGESVYTTDVDNTYGSSDGTSMAAAIVAGIAALLRSKYPDASAQCVRSMIASTCDRVHSGTGTDQYDYWTQTDYDRDPATPGKGQWNTEMGFGLVNARAALKQSLSIYRTQGLIDFGDVAVSGEPEADIEFKIKSCIDLDLKVEQPETTAGSGTFSIPPTAFTTPPTTADPIGTITIPSPGFQQPTPTVRVPVRFSGGAAGETTKRETTFTCVQTGEQETVQFEATSVSRPATIALVLDESGSMGEDSGVDDPDMPVNLHRIEVLHTAAKRFVGLLDEDDAVGLVPFSTTVDPDRVIAVAPTRNHQNDVRAAATSLTPRNLTAIGDGLVEGANQLGRPTVVDRSNKAILLLTDGYNNAGTTSPVDAVANHIPSDVGFYAIGMGPEDRVNSDVLGPLAASRGGTHYVTDDLLANDYFKLDKLFREVLNEIRGTNSPVDPEGRLRLGQEAREPFLLTDADYEVELVLFAPPHLFDLTLETPDDVVIESERFPPHPGTEFIPREGVTRFKVSLPAPTQDGEAGPGEWHAVLRLDNERRYEQYLERIDRRARETVREKGVLYNLSVQTSSNLRFTSTLTRDSFTPGATLFLRAVLTENGRPLEEAAEVTATVDVPGGTQKTIELDPVRSEPGVFEAELTATTLGVYEFQLVAEGETRRGYPFHLERLLTGGAFYPDERTRDERRRDDYVDDDRPDRDPWDGDDGRGGGGGPLDGGGPLGGGRLGGGTVHTPFDWESILRNPRLLSDPRFVSGLVAMSTAVQEFDRSDDTDRDN